MPIEQLAQIIGSINSEVAIMTMTNQYYEKALENDSDNVDKTKLMKEAHKKALDFISLYNPVHEEYIKGQMSKIQVAGPASPIITDKLRG